MTEANPRLKPGSLASMHPRKRSNVIRNPFMTLSTLTSVQPGKRWAAEPGDPPA